MKKGKIITIGGPSGVGKSSVLKELAKMYKFQGETKYDLVVAEAEKQNIPSDKIQKNFNELEKTALGNISDSEIPKVLDMHYAVNDADFVYSQGREPSEKELDSEYQQSTGIETIRDLAENSKLYVICLTADTDKLIGRVEKRSDRKPRSIDPYHVENESQNESDKFLDFYESARESNPNVIPIYINTNNKSPGDVAEIIKREVSK